MQSFQNHEMSGWHNSRGNLISKVVVIGHKSVATVVFISPAYNLEIMLNVLATRNYCSLHYQNFLLLSKSDR